MKHTMKLSEKEARILRDVCYSRMKALKAGDPQHVEEVPVQEWDQKVDIVITPSNCYICRR